MNFGKLLAVSVLFSASLLAFGAANILSDPAPTARAYAADSGIAAEEFVGKWTETVAKRGRIDVSQNDDGIFDVTVSWPNGAAEKIFWRMTAKPVGPDSFVYDDCFCTIRKYTPTAATRRRRATRRVPAHSSFRVKSSWHGRTTPTTRQRTPYLQND